MKGVKHFKTQKGYHKWLAYGHMHTKKGLSVKAKPGRVDMFKKTPGNQKVFVGGKPHKVRH